MDNEQAKLILSTYRPGGEDASDPFFSEALEQVRLDPELARWFADQRRFDHSMHQAQASVQPPAHLRDQLLVNRQVARLQPRPGLLTRLRSRPAAWMALAASITLLLSIGFLMRPTRNVPLTADQFAQEVFHLKQSGKISLGKMGGGSEALRAWLAQQGAPADFSLPAPLDALGAMGCQSFTIRGQKVALVCFMLDKDRIVHFFVMDNTGLNHPPGAEPRTIRQGGLTALTWSHGGRTYILTGSGVDEATLRRLI